MTFTHEPVMLNEVLENVFCDSPDFYVDLTSGGGGHAGAFLNKYPQMKAVLFDRDGDAVKHLKEKFAEEARVSVVRSRFSDLDKMLFLLKSDSPDIIFADLGVSSHQLDVGKRGFSIMHDGPFDMRMDTRQEVSALEYIRNTDASEIKRILSVYAQEREAGKMSRVLKDCVEEGLNMTSQIAERIRSAKKHSKKNIDPATLVFMAIRMAVNDEIGEIERMLKKAFVALKENGVLGIITFHSTEDRVVKNFFRDRKNQVPFYSDADETVPYKYEKVKVEKVIIPSDEEIKRNPRARSAKLRVLRKG